MSFSAGMSGTTPSPVTSAPHTPCPGSLGDEGWLLNNDHCYRVYSEVEVTPQSWSGALKSCHDIGADLMSIGDEDENRFVLSMVR